MKELHELGYTEIYTEKIADLVTGWIHKDGSIEYVLVNGKTKYKKGDMFNYDVKIVIAYHTFAKKCKCVSQKERLIKLKKIAIHQMSILEEQNTKVLK